MRNTHNGDVGDIHRQDREPARVATRRFDAKGTGASIMSNEYIDINPNIAFGKPCIKGTRISVNFILELLSLDWTIGAILENYPQLTQTQIQAAIKFAQEEQTS